MEKTDKKVVIVTGATSGIGLSAAELFLENGYTVYGIARKPYEGNFLCYAADVRDSQKIKEIFADIYAREGRIDVLVNNAGFGIAGAMEEASADNIRAICDVNLTSPCILSGAVIPFMKERGGKIINVSSVGGIMPLPYQATYSATKAGAEIFSRALANEVKPYGIKVTAVLPGDTKTGFTAARIVEGENAAARRSVEKMARDEQRGTSPEKVAKAIFKAAKKKNPPLRISVGFVSKTEVFLSRVLPLRLINYIIYKIYG